MKKSEDFIRKSLLDKKHEFNPDALWDKIEKDIPANPSTGFDWSNIFILSSSIAVIAIASTIYFSFYNNKNNTYKETLHATTTLSEVSSVEDIKEVKIEEQSIVSSKKSFNSSNKNTEQSITSNNNLIIEKEEKLSVDRIQKEKSNQIHSNINKAQLENIKAKNYTSTTSNLESSYKQSDNSNHSISTIIINEKDNDKKVVNDEKKNTINVFNSIEYKNEEQKNSTPIVQNHLHSKETGTLILGSDRNNIKKIGFYQAEDLQTLPSVDMTFNSLANYKPELKQLALIDFPKSSIEINPKSKLKLGISAHFGAGILRSETIFSENNNQVYNAGTDLIYELGVEAAIKFSPRWKIKSGILYQHKEYKVNTRRTSFHYHSNNNFSIPVIAELSWRMGPFMPSVGLGTQFNFYNNSNSGSTDTSIFSSTGFSINSEFINNHLANNDISILLEVGNDFFIKSEKFSVSLLSNWSWTDNFIREFTITDGNSAEVLQVGETISRGEYLTLRLRYHINLNKLKG